jgi:ribosomal protein L18E
MTPPDNRALAPIIADLERAAAKNEAAMRDAIAAFIASFSRKPEAVARN